jgi:hypothetical protein
MSMPPVLLPYQSFWVGDTSQVKVYEKPRRIGVSWSEAADDALYAARQSGHAARHAGADRGMRGEEGIAGETEPAPPRLGSRSSGRVHRPVDGEAPARSRPGSGAARAATCGTAGAPGGAAVRRQSYPLIIDWSVK